jgi:hypothetical protein
MPDIQGQLPISFAIPECKFSEPNYNKSKDYATVVPGDSSTYIFTDETTYYKDYNDSLLGPTLMKAGWDCMRHYEIITSYCMPYFIGLDKCPPTILTTLPKTLIKSAMDMLDDNYNSKEYYEYMDRLYSYAKNHLTTEALAKYVLSNI